jgi:hypothetical protein
MSIVMNSALLVLTTLFNKHLTVIRSAVGVLTFPLLVVDAVTANSDEANALGFSLVGFERSSNAEVSGVLVGWLVGVGNEMNSIGAMRHVRVRVLLVQGVQFCWPLPGSTLRQPSGPSLS